MQASKIKLEQNLLSTFGDETGGRADIETRPVLDAFTSCSLYTNHRTPFNGVHQA